MSSSKSRKRKTASLRGAGLSNEDYQLSESAVESVAVKGDSDYGSKPKRRRTKSTGKLKAEASGSASAAADEAGSSSQSAKPEKRLRRLRTSCPVAIQERVERVLSQRMYLVERTRQNDEPREIFKVLGSTGNVYTIVVDLEPSCDCPDGSKNGTCKHVLFVFLKVLAVPPSSSLWYQRALLSTELESIFASAPAAPHASATNAKVKAAYDVATGKAATAAQNDDAISGGDAEKPLPDEGDDCGICYDSMEGEADVLRKTLSWCTTCRKPVHSQCFAMWLQAKRGETCVYCRAAWTQLLPGVASSSNASMREGYLNLAGAVGASARRDTSTYYHGPRRGQRFYGYGYDRYND